MGATLIYLIYEEVQAGSLDVDDDVFETPKRREQPKKAKSKVF